MNSNKEKILHYTFRIFVLFAVFVLSLVIGSLYINGDQLHYTAVYNNISGLELSDAFTFYSTSLTSLEIIHFLIIFVISDSVDKTIFIALANTFLASLIIKLCDFYKVHFFVTATFLLTNFYMHILYIPAERLKFGFIGFILFLIYYKSKNLRFMLLFLSVAGHFQMMLVYLSLWFSETIKNTISVIRRGKISIGIGVIYSIIGVFAFLYLSEILADKVNAYRGNFDIYDYLKLFVFLILALIYSRKIYVLALFIPLFFAISVVGQDRVNMIGYLFFLFLALQHNRGLNFGVLITGIYFFYKTIIFVNNVIYYGTGFV